MNILVLAGGLSPERDVSLSSGSLIANALSSRGHKVLLADLYAGLEIGEADPRSLFKSETKYSFKVPETEPDLGALREKYDKINEGSQFGRNILRLCRAADKVFVALHGAAGENGQLQAAFDMFGIRYTGSGYLGSAIAMDKDIAKRMLATAGVPTAKWLRADPSTTESEIAEKIGFPCVIKPCGCGSSVGVSIVREAGELPRALAAAFRYERSVLAERLIVGREFSAGVVECSGEALRRVSESELCTVSGGLAALPAIEIIPKAGFYDYKNKYQSGLTEEITPADLTPEQAERIERLALAVHRTLGLSGYSRSDFILDRETGDFVCLEANTLPGMTPTSLLPQEAAAAGIGYAELCGIIAGE